MVHTEGRTVDPTVLLQFQLESLHIEINGLEAEQKAFGRRSNGEFVGCVFLQVMASLVLTHNFSFLDPRIGLGLIGGGCVAWVMGALSEGKQTRAGEMLEEKKALLSRYRGYIPNNTRTMHF